jgi:hypothetical protein
MASFLHPIGYFLLLIYLDCFIATKLWAYFSFVFSSCWAGLFKVKGKYDVIIVTSPPLFVGISGYIISLFKRTPFIFEII